jgi:trehalose-6-phosphate hydrolase
MDKLIPWWKTAVIYQIYPKSFQDTTSSGTGDLPGIIQRLDYLQYLGISAIWLTPIYPSPQVDNGYDVADYCGIDPLYGSIDDFLMLVSDAHQRGIRIIMDMVFNHTSTQHPWFVAAQHSRDNPYRQFYIWREGTPTQPPNNWQSKFSGSAWQWHAASQQYYLHLFAPEQADLNWQHPKVRQQLKQICRFWAELGVDGLRLDVVNLVSKDADFPTDTQGDGRQFYTDGPQIHAFLQEMSREVFQPCQLMTVGEMSSTTLEHCQQYAATDGSELSMTFNFHHLKVDYEHGEKWSLMPADFVALKALFSQWQQGMHNRAWNALFWCNHDQPRIVSRFGDTGHWRVASAKMLAMVLHGMQGTPYLYQGEELGMTNPGFQSIEQYRDIESLNIYQRLRQQSVQDADILALLSRKSRDNARTPMQWDASNNAGFTLGVPWISPCSNYREINSEQAMGDPNSILHTYRYLIQLRQTLPLLTHGDYHDLLPKDPHIWCYLRQWQGQQLLVIANLSADHRPIPQHIQQHTHEKSVLINNQPEMPLQQLAPYQAVYWLDKKVSFAD